MAQEGTLVVEGLKPLLHDFNRLSKTTTKRLREGLREIAAPVAIDAKLRESSSGVLGGNSGRAHAFAARTVSGIKVVVRQRGVSVEQTRRKTSDLKLRRSNYGGLQMTRALEPALADNAAAIERRTSDFLDRIIEGDVL